MSELTLELRPTTLMPRRMVVRRHPDDRGDMRVSVFSKTGKFGRMLAYGAGQPHLARSALDREFTFWVGRAGFDVTDTEAKQISETFGLEIPS